MRTGWELGELRDFRTQPAGLNIMYGLQLVTLQRAS